MKQIVLPAALAASVVGLVIYGSSVASGHDDPAAPPSDNPVLECEGSRAGAVVEPVPGPVDDRRPAADKAAELIGSPLIPHGQSVRVLAQGGGHAEFVISDANGELTALVSFVGSPAEGWRLEAVETCAG